MTAVSDNFNRANSSNLGASWTEITGDWEIVSNKCQCNTDAGGLGYYLRYETDTGSSDMFSQIVTSSTQASSNSNTGAAVRMRSAANTSYQLTTRHAGDTIGNWRIVAAVETQLSFQTGATSISTAIASGDTIRLEVVGTLLRSKVNGALVGLTVDGTITDGQRAGVNAWNEIASDVTEVDDFAGGALLADGGLLAPFIAGIGAQVTGTGTTLTPTVPTPSAGDLVLVLCTSRDAAQTMTAPGSEGWSSVESPSQTGLEDVLFAKVWGTGSTDDSTPTFSIGSGTAGWGATAVIIRNPSHATFPWTTVASAVVASGSAANASSATVTAPSVTDTGTHRTLARFFSSADDNALLTQNEGALAFGGANYDSTTGNDFAQAMSIREDVTTAGSTGTATVTETLVGNDVNNGVTLVLAIPSGTNGTATPAAIAATATIPRPETTTSAGPAVITATTAMPSATAGATGTAQPATIAGAASLPLSAPSGAASSSPASVALTASLPAVTAVGQTVVQPASIPAVAAIPAASASGAATATPAAVAAVSSLPAPGPTGAASATPATIAALIAFPPATAGAPASVQPATIIAMVTLPAASPSVSVTAQPATVQALSALPAPGLSSGAGPAPIVAVAAVPTPSVSAGGSVSITPATIQAIAQVLTASIATGAGPATVSAVATLPPAVASGGVGGAAAPATVAALIALPTPSASGSSSGSATPATVALVVLLPQAVAAGGIDPALIGRVVFIGRTRPTLASASTVQPLVDVEVTTS